MQKSSPAHLTAVLQALFVTFLWSTSWVLIKIGLQDIPALTFAGLRYVLAATCLLPFLLRPASISTLRSLTRRDWARLITLGLLFITIAQGAQFLGLALLPTVTVSLLLNFTPIFVVLMGIPLLAERPTRFQWLGITLYLAGIVVYFYPLFLPGTQVAGAFIMLLAVAANAASSVLGRHINRETHLSPIIVTATSMAVGSVVLLGVGAVTQGLPNLTPVNWLIVVWLAVVNTAFAFTLWNHTLRTISAMQSSVINGTMLAQIAFLAWLFLGEHLTWKQVVGMALVALATLIVQLRSTKDKRSKRKDAKGTKNAKLC